MHKLFILSLFLFLTSITVSQGQDLGILTGNISDAKIILKNEYPNIHTYCYEYDEDSVLEIEYEKGQILLYLFNENDFCYLEELRLSDLKLDTSKMRKIFLEYCNIDYKGNMYYDIKSFRYYISIYKTEKFIHIIKTVFNMNLSKKQETDERDSIVTELFGRGERIDVRGLIESFNQEQKDTVLQKVSNHKIFYEKIASENPEKISLRVELAKLRVEQIYPQLISLLE